MILMMALGAGLALARRPWSDIGEWSALIASNGRPDWAAWWTDIAGKKGPRFLVFQGWIQVLFCFLAPLTPALLVARLCKPRPALKQLARQPGLVASAALCLAVVIDLEVTTLQLSSVPALLEACLPGGAVLACWSALLAMGRWQAEASWVDRAGRLLGVFWIATIPWMAWLTL